MGYLPGARRRHAYKVSQQAARQPSSVEQWETTLEKMKRIELATCLHKDRRVGGTMHAPEDLRRLQGVESRAPRP